ncbi:MULTISPECIES: DUF4189 domain-containing protein [Alphaproteobacteria]|uniref:DUF4189 domain-containing protein n=2 Tax=Alphaproteobacteria TaxID=28211 RepID=A0A512HC97_9HYPH|nr:MULTISPECIES: DUF4189 domain-containing protein [Alphaproteobacteria]GEO83074.1 hypothetical protein RNA01_00060 [Ciceribacter naphthalenivorans]GLR20531.1 hypothetical protein GCM10007920_03150 [Ciceribacter naphthalenivorans]GLT03387.1 hypothetical protein GCM10007926_03150 [Sphingomonas psychrolutea]
MRKPQSCLAVLAFTILTPAAAFADSYGAIAYSPSTRADGWSHSFSTRADAERRALRECSNRASGCRVAIWFKNGCGALAVGQDGGWGSGWGGDRRRAELEAISVCNQHAAQCRVTRWVCSGAQ